MHDSWAESALLWRTILGFIWYQWDIFTIFEQERKVVCNISPVVSALSASTYI